MPPTQSGRGGARRDARGQRKYKKTPRDATKAKVSTVKREAIESSILKRRISEEAPAPGSQQCKATRFAELPLSRYTATALQKSKFFVLTEIQRVAIPHALAGRDVLGAAKTGSGKTLAFLVPILERLFHAQWSVEDGLGALIISPTRELAMQIMQVLRSVSFNHFSLSAGLVCGGKDFAEEQRVIEQYNIIVATPGRLLQHMEQTPSFDTSQLQVLVLDEADRILDMGFSDTLNSILEQLPTHPQRQTLLFSATQTKNVKQLAKLSLNEPEYVAVHEKSQLATPKRLAQTFVVVKLEDKLNMLYSFIRTHIHNKTIVFASSCKQVRFLFEAFRRIRPGVPLLELHGKMKQQKRMYIYYDFLKKPSAVLFATDIAARGLDFPKVDWVVQLDCPEDAETYIHRVGRTARFQQAGNSLLFLLPSEAKAMVALLKSHKIPLKQIGVNPNQAIAVTGKIAAEVAADTELKYLSQRAFRSYLRSVLLQPNKDIFDVFALDKEAFAESLGLANVPATKFLDKAKNRDEMRRRKNESTALRQLKQEVLRDKGVVSQDHGSDSESEQSEDEQPRSGQNNKESHDGDLFDVKRTIRPDEDDGAVSDESLYNEKDLEGLEWYEKEKIKKASSSTQELAANYADKKGVTAFQRLAHRDSDSDDIEDTIQTDYVDKVKKRLAEHDARDRAAYRQRIREKHRDERLRARGLLDPDASSDEDTNTETRLQVDDTNEENDEYEAAVAHTSSSGTDDSDSDSSDDDSSTNDNIDPALALKNKDLSKVDVADAEEIALQLLKRRRTGA